MDHLEVFLWSLMIRPWLVLLIDQASVAGQILIRRMDLRMGLEGQEALDHRGLLCRPAAQAALGIHQTAAPQLNQLC